MPSDLKCCRHCGRDTRASSGICGHFRGEGKVRDFRGQHGRKGRSHERLQASELAEMEARAADEGWAYEDDDEDE